MHAFHTKSELDAQIAVIIRAESSIRRAHTYYTCIPLKRTSVIAKNPTIYVGPSIGRSLRRKTAFKSLQLGWPYIWPCLQHKYQKDQQTELVHPSVGPSVKKRQALSLKTVADHREHATYLSVGPSIGRSVRPSIGETVFPRFLSSYYKLNSNPKIGWECSC